MSSEQPLSFRKYSGAGNTFVVFSNELQVQTLLKTYKCSFAEVVKWACDPVMGVHADGGFLLKKKAEGRWTWDFFNSDGSQAEMCGNAARCALLAISQSENPTKSKIEVELETGAGIMKGKEEFSGVFSVEMMLPHWEKKNLFVDDGSFDWLDTGVPHAVFEGAALSKERSLYFRRHPAFGARGANITSYQVTKDKHIQAITYERGVEDFTLACGTGAVAAALSYQARHCSSQENLDVHVQMPGGELVIVLRDGLRPVMKGPAVMVGEIQLSWESVAKFFQTSR